MAKLKTIPSAPKNTVSADSQTSKQEVYANYSFPFEPKTLDMVRKALSLRDTDEPNDIFEELICNKSVCSRPMLKEMFRLDNDCYLRRVFHEGKRWFDRGFYFDTFAMQVLRLTMDRDLNPIPFTPAQVKLRALLAKRMDWSAYDNLMNYLDAEYGLNYEDYFYYGDSAEIMEKCNISEEELLDALQTYQKEHRA